MTIGKKKSINPKYLQTYTYIRFFVLIPYHHLIIPGRQS